ncbi:hypothetical protein B0H10DRAFT_2060654 [Mycena sp. CBHHK59/15]|nr:hypothetical protein B0H10DRAFT_2060654 [Mycena sp. CBHHK59/15]
MPMPKLLKKLSRKSLRGHDSEHETEPELPPSLPVSEHNFGEDSSTVFSSPLSFPPSPKSSPRASPRPSGDWSREMIRSASTGNVPTNPNATNGGFVQKFTTHSAQPSQSSFTQKPPSRQPSYAPPSGSPPPQRSRTSSYGSSRTGYFAIEGDPRSHPGSVFTPSQLGYQPPTGPFPVDYHQDELSRNLAGAWDIANTAPKASKTDNVLQAIEGNIIKAQLNETNAAAVVTGITAGLEAVGGMEAIEHGLNTFMEGIPVLMNALDEVAKLHPFIGGMYLHGVYRRGGD